MLSVILFFISNSQSYFGNEKYMSVIQKRTNCLSSLNLSSIMFSTKIFESLIKLVFDAVNCCNYFDKNLTILYAVEFSVLIPSLIFNKFLCIFNNGLAEDSFGL